MPVNLAIFLINPSKRMETVDLRGLILDLCAWQAFRADDLATLWQRAKKHLGNKHLTPMVQAGDLSFFYPESPNHKWQAYLPANGRHIKLNAGDSR